MYHKIKWAYQRVRYGYDDRDVWNYDILGAERNAELLRKLADEVDAVPMKYCKTGVPQHSVWKDKIRGYAEGFEKLAQKHDVGSPEAYKQNRAEAKELLKDYWDDYGSLWD